MVALYERAWIEISDARRIPPGGSSRSLRESVD